MQSIYFSQTFEPEHMKKPQPWIDESIKRGKAKGGKFSRLTVSDEEDGMLIEFWKEEPDWDNTDPCWMMTADNA